MDGEFVEARVDKLYLQDGNTPTISRLFREHGIDCVFDPDAVAVFFDHSTMAPSAQISDKLKSAHAFCKRFGLQRFSQGTGISHVRAYEEGFYRPGDLVLGSDSHTCTGGALQCLALGMGATDIAAAMITGKTWLKIVETVQIRLTNSPDSYTRTKDVVLYLLGRYGQEPFLYKSMEWIGDWVEDLTLDEAFTVSSMSVEFGAKASFLTRSNRFSHSGMRSIEQDDALTLFDVDLSGLPPMVACPNDPTNVQSVDALNQQPIDYVFIGSCTNSRLEDIEEVAGILEGQQVHRDLYCLLAPGSQRIYAEAVRAGYIETLIEAGVVISPPGCAACVGTQGHIPASGDRVLSTMNRNFLGRMGNPKSEIYLGSPFIAAQTALRGYIPKSLEL